MALDKAVLGRGVYVYHLGMEWPERSLWIVWGSLGSRLGWCWNEIGACKKNNIAGSFLTRKLDIPTRSLTERSSPNVQEGNRVAQHVQTFKKAIYRPLDRHLKKSKGLFFADAGEVCEGLPLFGRGCHPVQSLR